MNQCKMAGMNVNSKERFAAASEHRQADRVPIDYLAHLETDRLLRERLGVQTERQLLDELGCDFYYLPGRDISQNEGFLRFWRGRELETTDSQRVCPLGIRWWRGALQGKFMADEAISGPLANAESPQDVLKHDWPSAKDFDFSELLAECEEHSGRVIIGGLWTGILGDSYRMMGFENFLLNMGLRPDLIKTLIDRMTDLYLELNEAVFSLLKGKLDIWYFGNDFGSQEGLLFSRAMWCEYFGGNIKRLTELAHSYGLKVMMHSCGGIATIIEDVIEAGVDILDPIQVSAKDMDINVLKRNFGDRLVFHGGIDTQHILPEGSTQEVRAHAQETIDVLGAKGGYIFAPSQTLITDIPTDNILAMYETAKRHRY